MGSLWLESSRSLFIIGMRWPSDISGARQHWSTEQVSCSVITVHTVRGRRHYFSMPVFRHYFSSSKLWWSLDFWLIVRHRLLNIGWICFFSKRISLSEDLIWSFISFKEIEQHFCFQIKEDVEESVQPCLRSWAAKIVSENRPAKIVSSTSYSLTVNCLLLHFCTSLQVTRAGFAWDASSSDIFLC